MEASYCKNETDLRKVSLHILTSEYQDSTEEQLELAMVCGCICDSSEEFPERFCNNCSFEDESLYGRCLLYEAIERNDKNIKNNIILSNIAENAEYPCVAIIHEDEDTRAQLITIVSINDMKDNTKYGYKQW